ncbi:MAG: ATP-binding protein [Olsenella sp.]|jgi:DNA replication protein DnaC|nr:ATP-binding protein [Olsenella sp.]
MSLESMRANVEELATPRFTDGAEDALLVGGPGVGKTRLAVAIGVEAAKAGREVRFAGCARLVEGLEDASPRGMLRDRLRHHAHSRPLVIDELGRLGMDEQGADPMSRPVSTRCERRPATITANVGIGGRAKVLGDEATAGAIADGACHRCTPTKTTGRPHRLEGLPADKRREGQSKTAKVR